MCTSCIAFIITSTCYCPRSRTGLRLLNTYVIAVRCRTSVDSLSLFRSDGRTVFIRHVMSPRRHNPYFANPPLATRADSRSSRQLVLTISLMSNSLCALTRLTNTNDTFACHSKIVFWYTVKLKY